MIRASSRAEPAFRNVQNSSQAIESFQYLKMFRVPGESSLLNLAQAELPSTRPAPNKKHNNTMPRSRVIINSNQLGDLNSFKLKVRIPVCATSWRFDVLQCGTAPAQKSGHDLKIKNRVVLKQIRGYASHDNPPIYPLMQTFQT